MIKEKINEYHNNTILGDDDAMVINQSDYLDEEEKIETMA